MGRLQAGFVCSLVLLGTALADAQTSVQRKCGTGEVRLRGSITNLGVTYQETVVIEKIGRSASHDGDWKMTSYQQVITYPWLVTVPFPIETVDVQQISPGIFMKVHGYTRGNQVITETVENNVVFTIRNNTFYFKANMKAIGTLTGDLLRFSWDKTNPLLPEDSGNLTGDYQQVSVSLLQPDAADRRFVFTPDKPGRLTIRARARVEPAEYAGQLQWQIQGVQGSQMSATPADLRGPEVEVVFTGLPESNNEFGSKEVRASLDVDGCRMDVRQTVDVFYPATAANNPSDTLPNWYYYWRQTPAARPENDGIVTEYEGRFQGGCQLWPGVPMHYPPLGSGGNGRIRVCDLANIKGRFFTVRVPAALARSERRRGSGRGARGRVPHGPVHRFVRLRPPARIPAQEVRRGLACRQDPGPGRGRGSGRRRDPRPGGAAGRHALHRRDEAELVRDPPRPQRHRERRGMARVRDPGLLRHRHLRPVRLGQAGQAVARSVSAGGAGRRHSTPLHSLARGWRRFQSLNVYWSFIDTLWKLPS